jgi:mucin-19
MRSARRYSKKKRNVKKKRLFHRRQTGGQATTIYTMSPNQPAPVTVSTLAITGAALVSPYNLTFDSAGNLYVCEDGGLNVGQTIKKLVPNGSSYRSILIAGSQDSSGFVDDTGAAAKFTFPRGIAVDSAGNIYVADFGNFRIRRIDTTGAVTTLAGSGIRAVTDGAGTAAQFFAPYDIIIDSKQLNLYVSDGTAIRKIGISNGAVSTVASGFTRITSLLMDSLGNFYVCDQGANKLFMVSPSGVSTAIAGTGTLGSTDGRGLSASFNSMTGIANDPNGNIYVADNGNNKIRFLTGGTFNVTTLAGTGTAGAAVDGASNTAVFNGPKGAVADSGGNVYVADTANNCIRVISSVTPQTTSVVSTVAGPTAMNTAGYSDGTSSAALFSANLNGIAIDKDNNLYVVDGGNARIRKIDSAGNVTTFAGNGVNGPSKDGTGTAAVLLNPMNVRIDPTGKFLFLLQLGQSGGAFTEPGNIRAIDLITGNVKTIYSGFSLPMDFCLDSAGNMYVPNEWAHNIVKLTPPTTGTTYTATVLAGSGVRSSIDGIGTAATFNRPRHVAIDPTNTYLYVREIDFGSLRQITIATGAVTTLTPKGVNITTAAAFMLMDYFGNLYITDCPGTPSYILKINTNTLVSSIFSGSSVGYGSADGVATAAQFNRAYGICMDSAGTFYVSQAGNWRLTSVPAPTTTGATVAATMSPGTYNIRKVVPMINTTLSTLTGQATVGVATSGNGYIDGTLTVAAFASPFGVCYDSLGNLYVSESFGNKIRKITPKGIVSTFAGSGTTGSADGTGKAATFSSPKHICSDPAGNIYVADGGNNKIRQITPDGVVTTFAGTGVSGGTNGTAATATFIQPYGICIDSTGNIYVVENGGCRVRKIDTNRNVTTLAGSGATAVADGTGTAASFFYPAGICADPVGNLYVTDAAGKRIRKITPAGVVTTFINGATAFSTETPGGICMDPIGNIYMATGQKIYKITPQANVTLFAGTGTTLFSGDGPAISGGFNTIGQICMDPIGNIICAVSAHNTIRKITINASGGGFVPGNFVSSGAIVPFSPATQDLSNPVSGKNNPPGKYSAPSITLAGGTRKKRRDSRRA